MTDTVIELAERGVLAVFSVVAFFAVLAGATISSELQKAGYLQDTVAIAAAAIGLPAVLVLAVMFVGALVIGLLEWLRNRH